MNNNNNNIPYGNDGVTPIGSNPEITKQYALQEQQNSTRAVENSFPTINPQQYAPGEIISDTYYNQTNLGVAQVNNYSYNTVEQDEARLRQIEKERQQGRSVYNAPPSVSGIPNIAEPPKPTDEGLLKAQREAQINSLTNKINRYQQELTVFQMKVINAEIGLKKAKDQLSELEENRGN